MTDSFDNIPVREDMQTIAFYNCENLFDIYDDSRTNDNDFLPSTVKKWARSRYLNKLRKLSFAISNIGREETGKHPALVGLAEVENARVVKDLIEFKHLADCNYGYVHYNSLDERGIDVALIYDKNAFEVLHSETFSVDLTDDDGSLDFTRDILLVTGLLDGEKIHVLVNHSSSRREGVKETEHKRMASSNKLSDAIKGLKEEDADAKIVIIGDFNDEPFNNSVTTLVDNNQLHNPMGTIRSFSRGTVYHDRKWNLFDQIMITKPLLDKNYSTFQFYKAGIFNKDYLITSKGAYKGSPYRSWADGGFSGGYSDHFPVYVYIIKEMPHMTNKASKKWR